MPSIELLAEVQALRDENRSLKAQIGVTLLDRDHWFERYKSAASDFDSLREDNNEMRNLLHLTELDAEFWKDRAERATHMAALWKRVAKRWFLPDCFPNCFNQLLYRNAVKRFQTAETELAALKKDARICAEMQISHMARHRENQDGMKLVMQAADRILEATKEG